ncbi:MAG: hypothetical protein NTX05_02720, partial [Fusobacteria bacterium]|nr:hypothetical protein [Fusobacteriota bacterium]
ISLDSMYTMGGPPGVSNVQRDMTTYIFDNWNPSSDQNFWQDLTFNSGIKSLQGNVNMNIQLGYIGIKAIKWGGSQTFVVQFKVYNGFSSFDVNNDIIYCFVVVSAKSTYSSTVRIYYSNSKLKRINKNSITSATCGDWSLISKSILNQYFNCQIKNCLNNYANYVQNAGSNAQQNSLNGF